VLLTSPVPDADVYEGDDIPCGLYCSALMDEDQGRHSIFELLPCPDLGYEDATRCQLTWFGTGALVLHLQQVHEVFAARNGVLVDGPLGAGNSEDGDDAGSYAEDDDGVLDRDYSDGYGSDDPAFASGDEFQDL
jgi:hypothetical protein